MKKILVLSFFFEPDLSAGSFRMTPIARRLAQLVKGNADVEVYTTHPNRYESFKRRASNYEQHGNLHITRVRIPSHGAGIISQAKSFFTYAFHVLKLVKGRPYDIIFATSGRMMTSTLATLMSIWKKAPVYLDIRDIFPDTAKDLLKDSKLKYSVSIFRLIEKIVVVRATRINLVSRGFAQYYLNIDPRDKYTFYTNGIDDEFMGLGFKNTYKNEKITILYAGNIGFGQGLESIIPDLAIGLSSTHKIIIIGDGGRVDILKKEVGLRGCLNVEFRSPVPREALIEAYRNADILFLHLNDENAFKKVLPSKIFEYAATGKPILAGITGYSAEFMKREVSNSFIFNPCDFVAAKELVSSINVNSSDRQVFVEKYSRRSITDSICQEILLMMN